MCIAGAFYQRAAMLSLLERHLLPILLIFVIMDIDIYKVTSSIPLDPVI